GIPDWVNEEEFSHNKALVFSADASMLVWVKYDEKAVKEYSIQMFKGSHPTFNSYADYPGLDSYKYPKAGFDNAIVSLWSFDIKAKRTQKMQLPLSADSYIPRLKATNDVNQVIAFTMNRHQDELCLYSVNPRSTVAQLLIKETSPKYIKEEAIENILITPNNILIPNDKEGAMNLYLYSRNGQLIRKIGNNNTVITNVYGINDATGEVYYQAALPTPHDRKVFVSKKNGSVEELTKQEGWNQARFSGDFKYFLNTWSNYNTPFVFTIRDNQGKVLSTPINNEKLKNKIANYDWAKRESFTFTTSEGIQLDGWMMKPLNFNPAKRYPVVLFQYSGPGSQQVINSWNAGSMGQGGAFDAYLAQNDIIVVCVDGRGTGGREAAFEKATYLQLGRLEAKDQVETALWLGKQSYVDKDKIGIWGWSFGGFNTLMSMSEGRKVFKAGVAVAAPTDWKFYDTIYTERYMRTPKENPDGYKDNPISRVNQLEGALLLCHGTADDNVHVQNAYEYSEALVQADKDFKELYYTNRNHSIYGGNTRNHLLRQISNFFIHELK
ncbi:MAG: DPP IV N-terminal domain-containing protein, partial [Prevotella nanceiensis]|nr:DPP IV N-terminal domain-containing protein [Hoylesella nanceiensis]